MTVPKLSVPASGLGGRGYRNPFTGEIVPGVTSVNSAVHSEGIVNWHIEQTVAYAVTHIDDLLSRTEDQGARYLQYVSRRMKQETLDDENLNPYNYSRGVLNDLSNLGNFIHDYIEQDLNDWFTDEPRRMDEAQMVEAYLIWRLENDIRVVCTEATLFGQGYAGTADWIGSVNGVPTLGDNKSSRKVADSHEAQLAALGATHTWAKEVPEGTPGAVYYKLVPSVSKVHGGQVDSWWVEEEVPAFSQYGVLQVRPDDYDRNGNFIPAFAEFHVVDESLIEAGWKMFSGALQVRHAQKERKAALKALGAKEEEDE